MGTKINDESITDKILNEIAESGTWLDYPYSPETAIARDELLELGLIESLKDAGIQFMNDSYIYIEKGNPRKVHIVSEGRTEYLSL